MCAQACSAQRTAEDSRRPVTKQWHVEHPLRDLSPQSSDYKSDALSIRPRGHVMRRCTLSHMHRLLLPATWRLHSAGRRIAGPVTAFHQPITCPAHISIRSCGTKIRCRSTWSETDLGHLWSSGYDVSLTR